VRILYRVEAERDVANAWDWYQQQQDELGRLFLTVLRQAETLLRTHPTAFPIAHGAYRRMLLHRFPYAVYYRPLDASTLEIGAVLHQRQDPHLLHERA